MHHDSKNDLPLEGAKSTWQDFSRLTIVPSYITIFHFSLLFSIDRVIEPESPNEQKKEMLKIVKSRDATVTARHYAFLDFEKFGLENWMPDFFGLIRDPVNRLISSFYYTRAAWNIVGKMEMFPQFKPPPVKYLRQDFESCVLKRKYLLHTYT